MKKMLCTLCAAVLLLSAPALAAEPTPDVTTSTAVTLSCNDTQKLFALPVARGYGHWKIAIQNKSAAPCWFAITKGAPDGEVVYTSDRIPAHSSMAVTSGPAGALYGLPAALEDGSYYVAVHSADGGIDLNGTLWYKQATTFQAITDHKAAYQDLNTATPEQRQEILEARRAIVYGTNVAWTVDGAMSVTNADGTEVKLPEFSDLFPGWDLDEIAAYTAERTAKAFLRNFYTADRDGRYTTLLAADLSQEALTAYHASLGAYATPDLLEQLMRNRALFNYDKHYAGVDVALDSVALTAREGGGYNFTVTLTADGKGEEHTGQITVQEADNTFRISKFWQG